MEKEDIKAKEKDRGAKDRATCAENMGTLKRCVRKEKGKQRGTSINGTEKEESKAKERVSTAKEKGKP